ncbi:MAG: 30S ribosomal protein S9, partial [Thermus sp.]
HEYFQGLVRAMAALEPLRAVDALGRFDAYITVKGGGKTGQIDAIKLGVARALLQYNADLRARLKPLGFLTRDAREVERKKYGKHKARRAPQYSKR